MPLRLMQRNLGHKRQPCRNFLERGSQLGPTEPVTLKKIGTIAGRKGSQSTRETRIREAYVSLVSPVLLVTVPAIDRSTLSWSKRDFRLLPAIRTGRLMHSSGGTIARLSTFHLHTSLPSLGPYLLAANLEGSLRSLLILHA